MDHNAVLNIGARSYAEFSTQAKIMSHKNIWRALQNQQLSGTITSTAARGSAETTE
jgi:hypothetical protein